MSGEQERAGHSWPRREFLRRGAAVAGTLYASAACPAQSGFFERHSRKPAPATPSFVYLGTDTARPGAKGIYVSRFDAQTGRLSTPVLAAATSRPSYLAMASVGGRRILYAANEGGEHDSGVSAFVTDPVTGALHPLGQVSSGGAGPCYLAVDATGSSAFAANYSGGTVASLKIGPDGALSQPVSRVDFHGGDFPKPGPMKQRQDAPHPHSAMVSPDNRFLVVNDLGLDALVTFPVDVATAKLGAPKVHQTAPGAGPRHLAFHPNGRWVYVVDELSNRVDQYLWNTVHGAPGQVLEAQALLTATGNSASTVAAGGTGTITAAEIALGPDGTTLYVSNRLGENSLVMFRLDGTSGAPKFEQRLPSGGKTPRQFTLDPTGNWLVCGNQDSDTVCVFRRDRTTGHLTGPVQTLPLVGPQMALFS